MKVYMDNAATTVVTEEVKDKILKVMTEDFGNPSSLHMQGIIAENYIKDAKEIIAAKLKVLPKEIVFTSGGTESNNTAIIGCARANHRSGKHIITSCVEHASVYEVMKYLEKEGFEVTYLPVDKDGKVSVSDVKSALREDTILVSIMHINNEIGSIMPIEEIGKAVHDYNKSIVFHVDAIQSFGKIRILPKKMNIDLLSVSGHKFHGPKGVGFLYVREGVKMHPLIYGGGQEKGVRSGTENVAGIAGLMVAVNNAYDKLDENISRMVEFKNYMMDEFSKLDEVIINSKKDLESAPHIVSASFIGVRSEVMLHSLEDKDIYVSSGSACSSNKASISRTLAAIGLKKDAVDSTIRFSFSDLTTKEEVEYVIEMVKELLPIRRVLRRPNR